MAFDSADSLEITISIVTINVANNPPTNIASPLYKASSGATGKLKGKLKATIKNVDEGPGIFNELNI